MGTKCGRVTKWRDFLRSCWIFALVLALVLLSRTGVSVAQEPGADLQKLREEVKDLQGKVAGLQKQTEKAEKKLSRDRINWGGELRLRMISEYAETSRGFYGNGRPTADRDYHNETAFPLRLRLNLNAEVIPEIVDVFGRLTINKRWGSYATWPDQDPLDSVNSFHSSIGSDVSTRVEHIYGRFNINYLNSVFYAGRLATLDGPPSRQNAPFPRVFIDSEVDGAMWQLNLPGTPLDNGYSPIAQSTEGTEKFPLGKGPLASYGKKLKENNNLLVAYAKYKEQGFTSPGGSATGESLWGLQGRGPDTDVYIGQGQIKLAKDTVLVVSGLYMPDWYMPRYSFETAGTYKQSETFTSADQLKRTTIPFFSTYYSLYGAYLDTQVWRFQVYGAAYANKWSIPDHRWRRESRSNEGASWTTTEDHRWNAESYDGFAWWIGMNTGDVIAPNQQFTVEYFRGDEHWINPLNYRGFRRKGTVLNAANNYYYNPSGFMTDTVVAGFYPVNAQIWDIYYDYYLNPSTRFRLGYLDFNYDAIDRTSPIGSSGYEHHYWPYFEINLSF
ncbi:MAG: hypothetical protein V1736_12700 [Pseudomonadota bacterium]